MFDTLRGGTMGDRYRCRHLTAVLLLALFPFFAIAESPKIPVTTSSKAALAEFMKGRDLVDNLRLTDAIQYFQRGIEKDPSFALAHLYLAQTAPTAKTFWHHLGKASELAGRASEGERLWIAGIKAGAYADAVAQREAYEKLVKLYPKDERAQTLLGIHYFGQQDYAGAAAHLEKAIALEPHFAPAYNQLGYAYRFLEEYARAEATFKKYTELIPSDPNPYDSYGELLLKLGRYDEAIAQYRKALDVNPDFANSRMGIAAAQMYKGDHGAARAEIREASSRARTEGERRAAHFALSVTYADEGNHHEALKELQRQYAIAETLADPGARSGDLVLIGNLLIQMGRYDEAQERFEESRTVVRASGLAPEVKENADMLHHYNVCRVAVAKKDLTAAAKEAETFRSLAEKRKNQNFVRLAHELNGMIALQKGDYGGAVAELQGSSFQNPANLFHLAEALQKQGDGARARQFCTRAANFNSLPQFNYAFVRSRARSMLSAL